MDQSKMPFLQSVLRYTTSHTTNESVNQDQSNENEQQREMSPERKKWLEEALDTMSVNPIDEIKKCFRVLTNETNDERRIEALETLKDWCEDMNFDIDFHKLNGYSLLPNLLNESNKEIRMLTCELIGTIAQNNPYCQETLIAFTILPLMLYKLDKDADDDVKIKALFAISCLTRDFEPGQQKLLDGNGLDILIKCLKTTQVEKLKLKSCFLFSSICNNKAIKAELTQKRLIGILIDMYKQPESNIHEHILSAINVLIDDNPLAIKHAKEMKEVNFKQILTDRISQIDGDPRFDEERDIAKKIFESLFQN